MRKAIASERTVMTADEYLNLYYGKKAIAEFTKAFLAFSTALESADKPAVDTRRFVEVPKRTRKLVTYDIPEIPNDEYEERFSITAEPTVEVKPTEYSHYKQTYLSDRAKSFFFNGDFKKQLHKIDRVTTTYSCMKHVLDESGDHIEVVDMNLHELNDYLATLIYEPNLLKVVNDVKAFQITNKVNYKGTSAVTEYAIIDHVGSLDKRVSNPCYNEAYRIATKVYSIPKARTYRMKEFCNRVASHPNWDKRDWGKGFKFKVRHRYNPSIVVLICDSIDNFNAKQAYNAWTEHGVRVEVVQANAFEAEHQFYSSNSRRRQAVANWAYACGWSLSAPLVRDANVNSLETYCKRSDADELRRAGEMHITKTSSRPESFLEQQRAVAPKREVELLHRTASACRQFALSHGLDTEMFFDIDRVKCPHCGKAMNPHNHKDANQRETEFVICTNCETRFTEDTFGVFDCKPYYEDNEDDNDYNA